MRLQGALANARCWKHAVRNPFDAALAPALQSRTMSASVLELHPGPDLAAAAARRLVEIMQQAVRERGAVHLALSGGSTPRALFRLLATEEWRAQAPWAHCHIWWADERCVPPDHHDSNYGVAYNLLLSHLPVQYVHRLHGEMEDAEAAARRYEAELRHVFGLGPRARPRFDLIMLGMGADGHTASLFPGSVALDERRALATTAWAPVAPHRRLTLTLPVLNRAAEVIFLVSGPDKAPALAQVFAANPALPLLPAALVRPTRGRVRWLVEKP